MRVLVCGHRTGLAKALGAFEIPFCIWHDRPVLASGRAAGVLEAPFVARPESVEATLAGFAAARETTHVIAGTERAVVAASIARRLLDARRSPHTVALRCHDKLFMKQSLVNLGVPMTEFVDGNEVSDLPALFRQLGSPVVLKERRESGGRGLELIHEATDRPVRLRGRLAERFVDAPEVSIESFVAGGRVLFQNITEYRQKRHTNVVPAGVSGALLDQLLALNARALEGLGIRWGLSHLECFITPGGPLFIELALRPPGGYIMELISMAYGFDAWRALVAVELDHGWAFPTEPVSHTAAIILHPGAGRVTRVPDVSTIRAHPAVTKARIKVRGGDEIERRIGAGQDVGYVLLRQPDRGRLLQALDEVERLVTIETDAGRPAE